MQSSSVQDRARRRLTRRVLGSVVARAPLAAVCIASAALTLLAACNLGPRYQRPRMAHD